MTTQSLFAGVLFSLFSCGQQSGNTQISSDTSKYMQTDKELWTLYAKSDTVYHVKRLVSSDSGHLLVTYDINASQPEATYQTFIKKKTVHEGELQKIKQESPNFTWSPFKATPVLFVQLQPAAFKDEMAALNKRHQVEQQIDGELESQNMGSWIAGDLGPGGANMLFEVQDIDKATSIIQTILSKNSLNKITTIGRQIKISADNWFYEVIYPLDYNGEFLTM